MSWRDDFLLDLARYRRPKKGRETAPSVRRDLWLVLRSPSLCALLDYRLGRGLAHAPLPARLKRLTAHALGGPRAVIQTISGIHIPVEADIGAGLYIPHHGGIWVNRETVMGRNCLISQGVTIGVSGSNEQRGVPHMGDHVYIGPNAVVAGKIKLGDGAFVAANSLVLRDVPAGALARGVPAEIVPRASGEGADVTSSSGGSSAGTTAVSEPDD
jgi:serine O-acetyltransferase